MKKIAGILTSAAFIVLLATGADAQEKVRIAVGGKSAVFYLPLSVAERLGTFKDAGLDVEISDVASGGRTLPSVVGGRAGNGLGPPGHPIPEQSNKHPVGAVLQEG